MVAGRMQNGGVAAETLIVSRGQACSARALVYTGVEFAAAKAGTCEKSWGERQAR